MRKRLAIILVTLCVLLPAIVLPDSNAGVVHADEDKLTVCIKNILYTKGNNVDGKAVAYDYTSMTMVKGQTKTVPGAFRSQVGGYDTKASGLGYDYQWLNVFVKGSEDGEPVFAESADEVENTISKISYKGDGNVVITYRDGTTETLTDTTTVYVAPVYSQTARWYLNYNYIDKISTGSGSWSNKDFVVSYSHTFSNPLDATPRSHYQFKHWYDTDTDKTYNAGDTFTYTGAELGQGETKNIDVYAEYQPSVTVRYHYAGNVSGEEKESFENITIYGNSFDHQGLDFAGWYDAEGNKLEDGAIAEIPAITREPVERKIVDVYARYNVTITPKDNSKVYGTEDPTLTAEVTDLASGDAPSYTLVREAGENVGKYKISVSEPKATTYPDGSEKYIIKTSEATFEITPKEIKIKIEGNKEDVLYDGKEHTVEGYKVTCEDELFDEADVKLTGEAKVSGTDPETYPMGLTVEKFSYDDANFKATFEVIDGELKISVLEKYNYKVEHYQQNIEDDEYTLADTENLTGVFNETVTATPKEYEQFILDKTVEGTVETGVLKIDNEVVLKLYYNRKTYDLTYKMNGGEFNGSAKDIVETYKYGEVVKIHEAPTRKGHTFSHWEGSKYNPGDEYTVTEDHTFTAQWIKDEVPNTGDTRNLSMWISAFGASMSGALAMTYVALKKKDEE